MRKKKKHIAPGNKCILSEREIHSVQYDGNK